MPNTELPSGTEPRVMSRRTFLKRTGQFALGLAGLAALGGSYVTAVEPRWLQVVHTRLALARIPPAFQGTRIAHFSDVHYEFHFGPGRLKSLVSRIMKEKPDLICFTGDLVDRKIGTSGEEMTSILAKLDAPLGKFAVLGNHDYYFNDKEVAGVLQNAGFRVLRNETVRIGKDGASMAMAGVEDSNRGRPNIKTTLQGVGKDEFILLLAHTPDYAMNTMVHPISLQLSGHSHGGQVRLPFHGPLVRVPGAKRYPDGLYRPPNNEIFQLYTNRGVGVTGIPVRFWCRPELTIHTIV